MTNNKFTFELAVSPKEIISLSFGIAAVGALLAPRAYCTPIQAGVPVAKKQARVAPAVSQANTIYVSPKGSDASTGTTAKPVATLERARDLARKLPRTETVRIVLRAGTYRLSEPLTLTSEDGGTEKAPVVWAAAPGEKVIVSGGVPLTGWKTKTVNGKGAWSLFLPEVQKGDWYFRSLYTDKERRQRARLPNTGFFVVADTVKRGKDENNDWLAGHDRFFFKKGDLSDFPDMKSAEAVVLTQWTESHLPLTAVDESKNFVTFDKFTVQNIGNDTRYWVENTVGGLDLPGEWTLNRETGELLYLPKPGETPQNTTLIAPRAVKLFDLNKVANIRFRNIQFSHSEWWFPKDYKGDSQNPDKVWAVQQAGQAIGAAVEANALTDSAFENCEFSHLTGFAIELDGPSRRNAIVRNVMNDLGAGGVLIGPRGTDDKRVEEEISEFNVVSDNHIFDGGHHFPGAVAVWAGRVRETKIVHNHIHDFYYSGVSVGWSWGFGDTPSKNNVVAWNHIHDLGKDVLGDGSGIYTLGVQPGTVIEGNVVHDVNGNFASRGIYLDDGSSGITVKNNLSYRNRTANYFQWASKNNRVENNVFAFAKDAQIELGGAVFNGGAVAMNFERNIIVTEPGGVFNAFDPNNVKSIYFFDSNLFWSASGKPSLPGNARDAGWGKNAVEADPLFENAAKNDFRLKAGSPALSKIGFVPVDWSKAGVRPAKKVAKQ
ncbi:MAG: right-handed parallel beta-helix repeat-containing protein [Akkermansiaceae bacterium]|nr:right-handed parallel beta-helix repeat-containing protein [Armatimonadota bacterium]